MCNWRILSAYNLPIIRAKFLTTRILKWLDESRKKFPRSQKQYSESLGLQEMLHLSELRRLLGYFSMLDFTIMMSPISSFRKLKRNSAIIRSPIGILANKNIRLCILCFNFPVLCCALIRITALIRKVRSAEVISYYYYYSLARSEYSWN